MSRIITSTDLLLNMKKTPDLKSQEFRPFWTNERDKCKYGLNIDGVFISGFLYYHLNFFKCQIDVLDNGRIIRKLSNPYLRDNEWIIDEYIRKAEEQKKGLCVLGSRRLAKSVFEASYISHRATFFKGTQNVIAGLNDPDIKIITDLVDEALVNLPDVFKKGRVEDNWKRQVSLGDKSTSGERDIWSTIPVRNLDGGKNTEALAGLSPFSMVIDEIGKGSWLECFSAAIPGFATPYGWRCSPLAFGTSGDMEKAQDAKKVFESPEAYNFLAVDVPNEPNVKRSIFISGHYAHDFPKDVKSLNEYLEIPEEKSPNLSKIKIQVTNFEKAGILIDGEREQAKLAEGASALLKITMYHPKNIHELFLTSSNNNFPIEEIRLHKSQLEEYKPLYVDLYRDQNNKVVYRESDMTPISKFPISPKDFKDAPCCMYEPPQDNVPHGTYCVGIDPYNEDTSSDKINSLGSIYVYKRMYNPLGEFQNSIVFSWTGRKKEVRQFHELALMVAEFYNAIEGVLPENEDKTLIQYFFFKKKGHFLADSFELAKQINPTTRTNRLKGLSASTVNQRHYMNLMYAETKDDISTVDERGEESLRMGVYKIPDIMLLEEMEKYRGKPTGSKGVHDGNFDRIIAFGHCLTLARYFDIKYPSGRWKAPRDEEEDLKKPPKIRTPWGEYTKAHNNLFIKPNKSSKPINRMFK